MKQKLIHKKREKEKTILDTKQKSSQRLALQALQKQLQIIRLKEWLVLISFVFGAALLRVPMQAVPSAEPLTFFAILAGWLFGKKKGFLAGASSLYISNFLVFGGHGPWTFFQALGFGIAGFIGGFLRKNTSIFESILYMLIATLIFEVVVNIGSMWMFPFSIFTLFLTALPFTLIHLVSNSIFALFLPIVKKVIYEKGKFNEKELCINLINRYSNKFKFNRTKTTKTTIKQWFSNISNKINRKHYNRVL